MKKRLIITSAVLVLLLGGISGIKHLQWRDMQAKMSRPFPPATVAATEVVLENWRPALNAVGTLVASNGIAVTTEVAGIVDNITFESGQHIQQGAILIHLDDTVDRAALDALRADRQLAEVRFIRYKNLLQRNVTSQSEFDEAMASFNAAKARVVQQEAVISKKKIRAPFSGLLGIREVDLGQYLEAGDPIVSLQALDPIYVDYTVPERYFQEITVGQDVQLRVDARPGEVFNGKISAIDSNINKGTRSLKVRATLANTSGRLRPGMFAEVQSLASKTIQVLTVPLTAISYNPYGDFVFVIEANENDAIRVKRVQVQTGEIREGRIAITKGLIANQRIVRAGLVKLRDGMRVKIDNSVELKDAEIKSE